MVRMFPRALVELWHPPTVLLASQHDPEGSFVVWDMAEKLPAILPTPNVLIKVRTILRRGGSVMMMAYTYFIAGSTQNGSVQVISKAIKNIF